MRRFPITLFIFIFLIVVASPAMAINVEDEPDYWGAVGFGPAFFENFGYGVYAQGGYYFTSWLGLGVAIDWSIDAENSEDVYERTEFYEEGKSYVLKHWEYSRRRQWFPAADLRFRIPFHEYFTTCIDLGLGAMIDDTYAKEQNRWKQGDATWQEEIDTSDEVNGDVAFMFRPAIVFKVTKFALGYRMLLVTNGQDLGHVFTVGVDWDI